MSFEENTGSEVNSERTEEQHTQEGSKEQPASQPEGYPPTSVRFEGHDIVEKGQGLSESETVDLSRSGDSDSESEDANSKRDGRRQEPPLLRPLRSGRDESATCVSGFVF